MATFADLLLLLRADSSEVKTALDETTTQIKSLADNAVQWGAKLAEGLSFAELAKSAFDAGEAVETAMSKIERATGSVGDDLHGLEESFVGSLGNLVQPANDVAGALALLSQRSGATGEDLTALLEINSKFAQVLDQQLRPTVEATQKIFTAFGVTVDEQPGKLDALLAIVQKSGANFQTLASNLTTIGPTLRAMGLDVTDSAALLANFETHGLNVSRVAATLNATLVTLAKEGFSDPKAALGEFLQKIVDAKDPTEALQLAAENFKGKGLVPLVDALQGGVANLSALKDAAENSKGTIEETATSTQTLGEKFTLLEGAVTKVLAPIGVEMVTALGHLVDAGTSVVKWFDNLLDKADELDKRFGTDLPTLFKNFNANVEGLQAPEVAAALKGIADEADDHRFIDGAMSTGLKALSGMFPAVASGAGASRDQFKLLNDELAAAEKNFSAAEKAVRMGVGTDEDATAARLKVLAVMQALHPEYKNIFADTDEWNSAVAAGNAILSENSSAAAQNADVLAASLPTISATTALMEAQAISLKARASLWPMDMAGIQGQADALTVANPLLNTNYVNMTALDKIIKSSAGDLKIQNDAIKQQTQAFGPLHDEFILGIQDQGALNTKMGQVHDAFLRVTEATDAQGNSLYSLHQQNVAQLADIDAQITAYQNAGISTDALQLKAMHLSDAIHAQNVGFTDTVTAIRGITTNGLDTAFDDLITGAGGVGTAIEKMGESIETTFANRILNDALKPVENELDTLIDKALRATTNLLGIGVPNGSTPPFVPNTPGLPPGVYTPSIGDLPPVSAPPGGLPGVNGQPGTSSNPLSSLASSSLTSIVSAVGSAVSAITGVIGVFQSAHQETSLNAIELNTRLTAIAMLGAWQSGDQQTIFAYTRDMSAVILQQLPSMRGALDQINGAVQNVDISTRNLISVTGNLEAIYNGIASLHDDLGIPDAIKSLGTTISAVPGQIADALRPLVVAPLMASASAAPVSFQGNVYLNGQELWSSFVTFLEQSGTKIPTA